ncbi:MAG: hypothetical protein DCC52_10990 [Chloroflexi bacterium]|nr:MAG: hypothetical protein DCC52_10990 [Chloroflexota bacterium]
MTALLSTDIGNTDKVAMFVADTRHQNIQVLPPDVRYSAMKFSIEPLDADGAVNAIRFAADGAIIYADKPFESLDDFCTRVDLKQVNRRVLESLIKAGACDGFGERGQLLETIDRMLSVSASHHNANAAGQMSLFARSRWIRLALCRPPPK